MNKIVIPNVNDQLNLRKEEEEEANIELLISSPSLGWKFPPLWYTSLNKEP